MDSSDPPPASPGGAEDSGNGSGSGGPFVSTPVIVALLSLSGVLGASLLTNWDKLFGGHAAKGVGVAAGASASAPPGVTAPDLQRLQGAWLSPVAVHPYQADRQFRLRLVLNVAGGDITGQVSDEPTGGSGGGPVFEIEAPRPAGDGIDFRVSSTWCCEDGKERPYETSYQVRPTSQGLAVTRRNNAPGGGKVERFLLERQR